MLDLIELSDAPAFRPGARRGVMIPQPQLLPGKELGHDELLLPIAPGGMRKPTPGKPPSTLWVPTVTTPGF